MSAAFILFIAILKNSTSQNNILKELRELQIQRINWGSELPEFFLFSGSSLPQLILQNKILLRYLLVFFESARQETPTTAIVFPASVYA